MFFKPSLLGFWFSGRRHAPPPLKKAKLLEPPLYAAAPPISTAGVSHQPPSASTHPPKPNQYLAFAVGAPGLKNLELRWRAQRDEGLRPSPTRKTAAAGAVVDPIYFCVTNNRCSSSSGIAGRPLLTRESTG